MNPRRGDRSHTHETQSPSGRIFVSRYAAGRFDGGGPPGLGHAQPDIGCANGSHTHTKTHRNRHLDSYPNSMAFLLASSSPNLATHAHTDGYAGNHVGRGFISTRPWYNTARKGDGQPHPTVRDAALRPSCRWHSTARKVRVALGASLISIIADCPDRRRSHHARLLSGYL